MANRLRTVLNAAASLLVVLTFVVGGAGGGRGLLVVLAGEQDRDVDPPDADETGDVEAGEVARVGARPLTVPARVAILPPPLPVAPVCAASRSLPPYRPPLRLLL